MAKFIENDSAVEVVGNKRSSKPAYRSASDEVQADGYLNLTGIIPTGKSPDEALPLNGIDTRFGTRLYLDAGALPKRMLELAQENGGHIDVMLRARVQINSAKSDDDEGMYDAINLVI